MRSSRWIGGATVQLLSAGLVDAVPGGAVPGGPVLRISAAVDAFGEENANATRAADGTLLASPRKDCRDSF